MARNNSNVVDLVRRADGQFVPGHPALPGAGRPKGARTRFAEAFILDLAADWKEHGKTILQTVREKSPATYLKCVTWMLRGRGDDDDATEFDPLENPQEIIDHLLANTPELVSLIAERSPAPKAKRRR